MFLGGCITLFHKNHQKSSFLMEHAPTLKSEPCLFSKPEWTVSCKLMGSQTFAHYFQTCSNHHATYNAPYQTNNQKPKYKLINFEGPSSLGQPVQPIILPQFAHAKTYLILSSFLYIIQTVVQKGLRVFVMQSLLVGDSPEQCFSQCQNCCLSQAVAPVVDMFSIVLCRDRFLAGRHKWRLGSKNRNESRRVETGFETTQNLIHRKF